MAANASLAIFIFVVAYALIVSEKVHRTVVALGAAMIVIFAGILSQSEAIHHIDFNTLGLLIGMMVVVNITSETGLFNYLAIWSAKKVKADPIWLLFALSALTGVCSAFLDNVTTVLLTVPVTFSITSQLKVNPKPFLVAQILAANIGGTATLIGDPPNIMLGSAVKELDFMAFLTNLSLVCILIFIVTMALLVIIYRKELHTTEELKDKVMRLKEKNQISNVKLLKKCLFVLAVTITLFMFHSVLHLETASAALAGASLLMAAAAMAQAPDKAAADPRQGTFKTVQGDVTVVRDNARIAAIVGAAVKSPDRILTGAGSAAALTLQDGTVLAIGPDSALDLSQFQFNATTQEGSVLVSLLRGSLRMATGAIARLKPEQVKVTTPTTVIGVRGTDFIVEENP